MHDRDQLIARAAEALRDGLPDSCDALLQEFAAAVARRPLTAAERPACERQLSRLRALAVAAMAGLDQARAALRDIAAAGGGLDVYDRSGRQRVATGLARRTQRF
ncbi:hypothetical protein [Paracoccus luteus]|uniref:hypothetical protein n=1 Tax=Paracoccus luteus TaxID=2508543 RepID=UPI00106F40DF|nr:hypothetical protein [Paracoccus luteus]